MKQPKIFIVHLRRPMAFEGRAASEDRRDDPFWEFGSFGCTTCHATLLKHVGVGDRLAFAQGGPKGTSLVFLSPPVDKKRPFKFKDKNGKEKDGYEVKWNPCRMPFCYEAAPILVDQNGTRDFPNLKMKMLPRLKCPTWPAQFGCKFRSHVRHLSSAEVASEVAKIFDGAYRNASLDKIAKTYLDAIPGSKEWRSNMEQGNYWRKVNRKKRYEERCANGGKSKKSCRKRGC